MVLISRKVDYAILLLCHLRTSGGEASARELAERFGLSRPFVANILKLLCQNEFVESHRGINGGYRLACDPKTLTLEALIAALDGPFQFVSCAGVEHGDKVDPSESCGLFNYCPVRGPLRAVQQRLLDTLAHVTIEDLALESGEPALINLSVECASNG